jgi:chromate transporter
MRDPVYYSRLGELAAYFLRLGSTAFGGPAAHIALMEAECVGRRQWISRQRFLDVLGAANLIPGPTSTELAMHIGYVRAGWAGLVVSGVCFILPAALLVGTLAAVYVERGAIPAADAVLGAIKPVVVVVIGLALIPLAGTAIRSLRLVILAGVAAALALRGINEVLVLLLVGIVNAVAGVVPRPIAMGVMLPEVFAYFLKAGASVFGSGYVLFAIFEGDLVGRWISEDQLLDAIAVGQVTPGPVFTAATFIGYLVAGPAGAVVATIGVFLPAFVCSALSAKLLRRVGAAGAMRAFLDGVNAAAVALIGVVLATLLPHAIVDVTTAVLAAVAAVAIGWWRVNPAWVILAAAAIGSAARLP